jgi:DnaA family protein
VSDRQLALAFPAARRCTFANFAVGPNVELVAALQASMVGDRFAALWLVGESGGGKSHLLQAACHAALRPAAYLPATLMAGGPEALDGLERYAVVAIDDIERWLGERRWEETLLGLYQRLFERRGTLLLASHRGPLDVVVGLPDLASRLRAAQTYLIRPLDDADRGRVIEALAAQRGLEIGPDVVNFLLHRAPRRMDALIAAFDRLDRGALARQRRLTIPLAKDVLGL